MTPLFLAASSGLAPLVQVLMDSKANLNVSNNRGVSAIAAAVLRSRVGTLRLLCSGKADVHACVAGGYTVLDTALFRKNTGSGKKLAMVNVLLDAKSDPNRQSESTDGEVPLMKAVSCGSVACVDALLSRKADANVRCTANGKTVLMFAVESHDDAMVEHLLGATGGQKESDSARTIVSRCTHLLAVCAVAKVLDCVFSGLKFLKGQS